MIRLTAVSSTEKIFSTGDVKPLTAPVVMFEGESVHLQVNLCADCYYYDLSFHTEGGAAARAVSFRRVGFVPTPSAMTPANDEYYIDHADRVYPDVLETCNVRHFGAGGLDRHKLNHAFFLTVTDNEKIPAGDHTVVVRVKQEGKTVAKTSFVLRKIALRLPEQTCISTNWMHYDSFINQHHVKLFSRDFYKLFASYLKAATYAGQNMLLIPLFTPAVDTRIGGERKTAQLLDIREGADGHYIFDFTAMRRFIEFVLAHGIKYLEMPPLFTQWGALHAPKIMVRGTDGRLRRRFGWDTDSLSPEYQQFLKELLPAVVSEMRKIGMEEKTFFHVSDEPTPANLERYRACLAFVKPLIGRCNTLDACGDIEFAGTSPRAYAVCVENRIQPFLDAGIRPLCTYYCCSPRDGHYPNRFIAIPYARTAILGAAIYRYDVDLFLHWGFNFYNSQLSNRPICPYNNNDADGMFPAGDGFIVYPDYVGFGAYESLRSIAMHGMFRLTRLLKALEARIGREGTLAFLDGEGVRDFNEYPTDPDWYDGFILRLADKIGKNA